MSTEFGARLRQLRMAAGLTQETLAERSGLSVNAISALERGERQNPYPRTIQALADALNLAEQDRASLVQAAGGGPRTPVPAPPQEKLVGFPTLATPTFGRERDIAVAAGLLHQPHVRLLTLTGPGGVGKTRLAHHVGQEAGGHFPDGALFVGLAPISDPTLVVVAIHQAFAPERQGTASLHEALRERTMLLVLDNFEQVTGAAPDLAALLQACPKLKILVTSRRPLRIDGEQEYPVAPLTLPSHYATMSTPALAELPAVTLFVQRARAVRPDLVLTPSGTRDVAALCAQLDGLPLALELAASRAKVLSPQAILANLSNRLVLLTGGGSDRPERLQTMRGAISWSFEQLSPGEQAAFRRMSVFRGEGMLEAVAAVAALEPATDAGLALDTLDAVSALVDHSLVQRDEDQEGGVYLRMLEVIREFAAEQLEASGEGPAARDVHATMHLRLATRARLELEGPRRRAAHSRIQRNLDNLRAALAWLYEQGDTVRSHQLVAELARFWINFGYLAEGWTWLERVLKMPEPEDPDIRFEVLYWASITLLLQDRPTEAEALSRRALELARQAGNVLNMGKVQSHLGEIIGGSSPEEARVLFVESLALFRSINEPFREATALRQLGLNAAQRGDLGQALEFHTRALEIWRNIGHPWGVTISLRALAEVALAQGELETARLRYRESLGLWRDLGERLHMSECFSGLARVALGTGQAAEAVQLLGAQSRLDEEMGYGHPGKRQDQLLADAKAALDPVQYELYWNEGRQMTLDDVLDMVIAGSPA